MMHRISSAGAIDLGELRIGEALRHSITIPIPGGIAPELVSKVTSSCGCAQLELWRPCELNGGTRGLELAIATEPGPYDTQVSSQLTITGTNGQVQSVAIRGTIEPPFEGWPTAIIGSFVSGAFTLTIPEGYCKAGLRLHIYDTQGRELPCERKGERFVVGGVDRTRIATYEAVVEFPRDPDRGASDEGIFALDGEGSLPLRWAGVLALKEGEAPVH